MITQRIGIRFLSEIQSNWVAVLFAVDLSDRELDSIVSRANRNQRLPESQKIGDMWNETRQQLDQFYEASNRELGAILQDEKYLWKNN